MNEELLELKESVQNYVLLTKGVKLSEKEDYNLDSLMVKIEKVIDEHEVGTDKTMIKDLFNL